MKTKYILIVFAIVAVVQLAIPAQMIVNKEQILTSGKTYKFNTEPVDPNDPFRGKYIILRPKHNTYKLKDMGGSPTEMYATFNVDKDRMARVSTLTFETPSRSDHLKVQVHQAYNMQDSTSVFIDFPFDRYYMNEHKALKAELMTRSLDTLHMARLYAEVYILEGNASVESVKIDGKPIEDIIE